LVLVVGRQSAEAKGVRGPAFAAGRTYAHAIERAGGTPVIVPPLPELGERLAQLVRRVDAVVLHGGGDVHPRHYGQDIADPAVYGIVDEHDLTELAVVTAVLDADVPMLAVCRGLQVLTVAMGGTLQQHIGSDDHWFRHTTVVLTAGSRAAGALGGVEVAGCHCVHHQAIDIVPDGMVVTGTADGIVHAAEVPAARWVVGVQWHPEDTAATDPAQQSLFTTLVAHT
jgi:putative glutamine amidotransferase